MAYSYVWPISLPQNPLVGHGETFGASFLSTPMDSGPAKRRWRGKLPNKITVDYVMTVDQVETLRAFIEDTLKLTRRFGFPHPRTAAIVEARIIPASESESFAASHMGGSLWTVKLTLEILP